MIEVRTHDSRLLPERAHFSDAGADLRSPDSSEIYPNESKMISTGISIRIPYGYVGLVYSRSSQGLIGVSLANSVAVIDSDYRGEIKLLLVNSGDNIYKIRAYDTKIAQLVLTPISLATFDRYRGEESTWYLTSRGIGGFGSTNKDVNDSKY